MEARVREEFPEPPGWAYEPKWDGFRVLAWRDEPRLDSRNRRPLLRYFPELQDAIAGLPAGTVVDGEVLVVRNDATSFDTLQQRLHPAESRVNKLAAETPASLVAFDLLALEGQDLRHEPFAERRRRLAELAPNLATQWSLTPSTTDLATGKRWFEAFEAAGCDGIVAKRLDGVYQEGERAMTKIKHRRSLDAVVGGYRPAKDGNGIGSLLLGLYDEGELDYLGHCSNFSAAERSALFEQFEALRSEESFGARRRPEGESRWTAGRKTSAWVAITPGPVAQVSYDQITGGRFRHATRFERWRPDKDPEECTVEQLARPAGPGFREVVANSASE